MSTEPLTAAAPASQEVSNDSGMEGGSVPRSGGGRPSYGSTDARTEAGALSTESDLSGGAVSTFVRAAPSDGFRPCAMVAYGYDRCNPGATSGILFMWQEEGSTRRNKIDIADVLWVTQGEGSQIVVIRYVLTTSCCSGPRREFKPVVIRVGTASEAQTAPCKARAAHRVASMQTAISRRWFTPPAPVPMPAPTPAPGAASGAETAPTSAPAPTAVPTPTTAAPVSPRRFLVVINPVSGPGHAQRDYEQHAAPIFSRAGIDTDVVVTAHAGHATELAQALKISPTTGPEYDGIVAVGGDGLLAEVVQGMLHRDDWRTALSSIPVAPLPGGSGNGLVASICKCAGEGYGMAQMAFLIARGQTIQVDAASVFCAGKRYLSFLVQLWAVLADIDIESERLRCMGNARFTVQGVIRAMALRRYRGRFSYYSYDPSGPPSSVHNAQAPASATAATAEGATSGSTAASAGAHAGASAAGAGAGAGAGVGTTAAGASSSHVVVDVNGDSESKTAGSTVPPGPPLYYLDAGNPEGALPHKGWKTVQGDFKLFASALTPMASLDSVMAPEAALDDGLTHITFNQTMGRMRATQILLQLEGPDYWNNAAVHKVKCHAFRLEPERRSDGHGFVDVDGEVLDYAPMSVEVHRKLLTVFGLRTESPFM